MVDSRAVRYAQGGLEDAMQVLQGSVTPDAQPDIALASMKDAIRALLDAPVSEQTADKLEDLALLALLTSATIRACAAE